MFRRAGIVAAMLSFGSVAHAETTAQMLEHVDPDASAILVVKPNAPIEVMKWLKKFAGATEMLFTAEDLQRQLAAEVGVDLLEKQTWTDAGLDMDSPAVASLFAVDHAAADKAFQAVVAGKKLGKRPWVRTRVAIKVVDAAKLAAAVGKLSAKMPNELQLVAKADPAALAAAFGADAKQGKAIVKALDKAKVLAAGRFHEALLFMRVTGGVLVVDLDVPFGNDAVAFDWKKEGKDLLKVVGKAPPRGGAAGILTRGAGQQLATADAGIWVEPVRLLEMGKAAGWNQVLGAVGSIADAAQRKLIMDEGAKEVLRCEDFREVAASGPFEDAAFTLRLSASSFEGSASWGLRGAFKLAGALVTADDGILDLAAATDAVAIGVLYLNGFAPLRALPRPGVFGKGLEPVFESAMLCGFGGFATSFLFGWPQLMAAGIEEEAAKNAQFKSVIDHLRNGVVAMKHIAVEDKKHVGVIVGSFDDSPDLAWIPKWNGGKVTNVKAGTRTVELYKAVDAWDPHVLKTTHDAGRIILGVSWGDAAAAIKWFWGKTSPKTAGAAPYLALGRVDLPAIFKSMAAEQPYMAPVFDEIRKRVGQLTGSAQLTGDQLISTMKLEVK